MQRLLLISACLSIFTATGLFAATYHVPDDFSMIQLAIEAALDGDTVMVADGTFSGFGNTDLNFWGKDLVLLSESGPEQTIIDGEGLHRGIWLHNGETYDSKVSGFTFLSGYAMYPTRGGAILCENASPSIQDCIFSGNSAGSGGACYFYESSAEVQGCLFEYNVSTTYIAGGIYCNYSPVTVKDCIFEYNSADLHAGGFYTDQGDPTVENCYFYRNTCDYAGGAIFVCYSSAPTFTNCYIIENSASDYGGGISCYSSFANPHFINCTIAGNTAGINGGGARIRWTDSPGVRFSNCIIWDNSPNQIHITDYGDVTVSYSDIEGGWAGTGNINADPLFLGDGDYHISTESPCVDAADGLISPAYDYDYDVRPIGEGFDIGADEAVNIYEVMPPEFDLVMVIDESDVITDTILVTSNSHSGLDYSLYSDVEWITFLPSTGDIPGLGTDTVTVIFDGSGLQDSSYTALINIDVEYTREMETVAIPVSATVLPPVLLELICEDPYVSRGERLYFDAIFTNLTGELKETTGWVDAYLLSGEPYSKNPVLGPESVYLAPYSNITFPLSLNIPLGAPLGGYYSLCGNIEYESGHGPILEDGCFDFTIGP